MKWPWVSRALYDRALEDIRELKEERKALLGRVLGDPVEALAEMLPDPASKEAEEMTDPQTGLLTAASMKAVFRNATRQPVIGRR